MAENNNNNPNCYELLSGTTLSSGKYTIEKKIGEGGFGITYKALQSGLNRIVCIKEYFPSGRCIRDGRTRNVTLQGIEESVFEKYRLAFVREAKMLATLHHPNIVEVIDTFDENDTSYMVMGYVQGRSLQSIVETGGPVPYPEAVNYLAQITDAVGYIHERHILHRDIKPDNIMITADYKAILIDFGSAREFEQDKVQMQTSMLTHGYAPTEQYTSNSRKGSYTDIYAIGATFYFVLTGKVPLEAAARLTETMKTPRELNPGIPDEANRTIMKAMQLKPENRHQTIQEFMDDLRNIRPSSIVNEDIAGETEVNTGEKKRKLWWIPATASGIAAIAAVIMLFSRGEPEILPGLETADFTGMNIYPMVKVTGGEFVMGNDETDGDCPRHRVTLSDFYIGQFEVHQGLWEEIMGDNPSAHKIQSDNGDKLPVENVSFEMVTRFIENLNRRTGRIFSLPTEAQWEYAARGGSGGDSKQFANNGDEYINLWYNRDATHEIRLESTDNKLGIYQMSGNVSEWCADYYAPDFYTRSENSTDPINNSPNDDIKENGPLHVIRGGSFRDTDSEYLTVFYREAENSAQPYIGFRLVLNQK